MFCWLATESMTSCQVAQLWCGVASAQSGWWPCEINSSKQTGV